MNKRLSGIYIGILWFLSVTSCLKSKEPINTSNTEITSNIEIDNNTEIVNSTMDNRINDPLLLSYFLFIPTIKIDISKNVVIQQIWYNNFDQKDRSYGDDEPGTERYTIFLFCDGIFYAIDNVETYQGKITRSKERENIHNPDESITVNLYRLGTNQISAQHIFIWNENILVANHGNRDGRPTSVVVKNDIGYQYFYSHRGYASNLPSTLIEFKDKETIIYIYNSFTGDITLIRYYVNGILMNVKHEDGRTETYTVSSGAGELLITDSTGNLIEKSRLEREINEDGYLVYELVVRQAGDGYEFFYTKDTF